MSDESKAVEETAKATQEVARTAGKAIDLSEKFGRFVSKVIAGPLEQATGIIEDKLKYLRWERQLRFMQRADEFSAQIGLNGPTRAVPLKFAIPLLQAASLEDDDDLQDRWAKLLVNAFDAGSQVTIRRAFIDILENIGSLEAKILDTIYTLPFEEMKHRGAYTKDLPASASIRPQNPEPMSAKPSAEVELALANLARLGCLSTPTTWGGGEIFTSVNPTLLGKALVEACSLPRRNLTTA